ncbi:hypothetical protein Agub_g203, partial [Astrephomene gubernaculifera]
MPKEVITLSFGSYASFVSAHFWNLQDEAAGYSGREGWAELAGSVEHGALFQEVEATGHGPSTYRPRAIWYDIVGSSGGVSFSPDGTPLPPPSSLGPSPSPSAAAAGGGLVPSWSGGCEVHRAARVARSAFLQQLEAQEELDWEGLGEEEAARHQAALEAAARQLDAVGGGSGPGAAVAAAAAAAGAARHWTDFCKVLISPRSVCTLPGAWRDPL